MKRIVSALAALTLSLCCAAALGEYACAQVTADLLDAPKKDAQVLMRYCIGTRVEVVREVDDTYVQVNAGKPGGSLMGYMERRDLVFGERALRQVRAESVTYMPTEIEATCRLYSYPDAQAPVIDEAFHIGLKQAMGSKDGEWLHVEDGLGGTGFVRRSEIELSGPHWENAFFIYVEPDADEMTREAAIDLARKTILESEKPGIYTDGAALDILYYYEMPDVLMYSVQFRDPQTGYLYAAIDFLIDGYDVVQTAHGNG